MDSWYTKLNNRGGFTRIQFLLIIPIVGLLVSIPMYNLLGSQAKRRDAKRVLDVAQIEKGLALYFDKTGAYPVFTGCIDGKALDTVTSGLRKNDLLPATVTISDSQNPSNPRSCYYYIGLASRYSLRYTLETTSSAGIAGDHLDRL